MVDGACLYGEIGRREQCREDKHFGTFRALVSPRACVPACLFRKALASVDGRFRIFWPALAFSKDRNGKRDGAGGWEEKGQRHKLRNTAEGASKSTE